MATAGRTLSSMTRDRVGTLARSTTSATSEGVIREMDRRANRTQAEHLTRTAYIATGAAIVSAFAALVAVLARP